MKYLKYFESFNDENSTSDFYPLPYKWDYEWVPTNVLEKYIEFTRDEHPEHIQRLKTLLADGFNQPLILQYSKKYNTAYLIEGNHRFQAAKQLGIKYIPVRVTTDGYQKSDAIKVDGTDTIDPTKPSQIGIHPSYDKEGNMVPYNEQDIENTNYSTADINKMISDLNDVQSVYISDAGYFSIVFETSNSFDPATLVKRTEADFADTIDDILNNNYKPNKEVILDYIDANDTTIANITKDYSEYIIKNIKQSGYETPNIGYIRLRDDGKWNLWREEFTQDMAEHLTEFDSFEKFVVYYYDKKLSIPYMTLEEYIRKNKKYYI